MWGWGWILYCYDTASLIQSVAAAAAALSASLASSSTPSGDYCHYETVRAACNEGDVILVRRAVYGRMKLGRCVKVCIRTQHVTLTLTLLIYQSVPTISILDPNLKP